MPCYYPLQAWRGDYLPSGKREIVFKKPSGKASAAFPLTLPCGQCTGCRLERSRQWAMRNMDEAQMSEKNCFLTLTYDDVNVPEDGGLNKKDFQDFMKRLRRWLRCA